MLVSIVVSVRGHLSTKMITRETTTRARKRAAKTAFMLASMALVLALANNHAYQTHAFVPQPQRISTRRSFVPPQRQTSVVAKATDGDGEQWYASSPSREYSEQEKIRQSMNDNKNNNNVNVNSQGHQKDDPEWKFFDTARMHAAGGDGGTGCVAFRREKGEPRGGPSGGSGGRGGSIYLVCDEGLNTLAPIRNRVHVRAKKGKNGLGKSKHGIKGHHILVRVPKGTVVRDLKTNKLAGELREHGESLLVAKGGRGGRGNKAFMTHRFTSPKLAERGEPGVQRWLAVELRLVADVGFLGKPNAGKSTLLASASAARPKIADYPFTTVVPNLGVCDIGDEGAGLVLCDIPGLIEGAAGGAGLGPAFLRHVQRCKVLLHVIDATAEDPIGDFHTINKELAEYDEVLAKKEQVVILNKNDCIDEEQEAELLKQLREAAGHTRVLSISAVTKDGVKELMGRLKKFVSAQPEAELPPPPEIDLSKAGLDYDSDDFGKCLCSLHAELSSNID